MRFSCQEQIEGDAECTLKRGESLLLPAVSSLQVFGKAVDLFLFS